MRRIGRLGYLSSACAAPGSKLKSSAASASRRIGMGPSLTGPHDICGTRANKQNCPPLPNSILLTRHLGSLRACHSRIAGGKSRKTICEKKNQEDFAMANLHPVKIAPKGMGLNDFVAFQEGFFKAEGLD